MTFISCLEVTKTLFKQTKMVDFIQVLHRSELMMIIIIIMLYGEWQKNGQLPDSRSKLRDLDLDLDLDVIQVMLVDGKKEEENEKWTAHVTNVCCKTTI